MSPYRPTFNCGSGVPLIALAVHTMSPQTTGLEWPRPDTGTRHFTSFDSGTLHCSGSGGRIVDAAGVDAAEAGPVDTGPRS